MGEDRPAAPGSTPLGGARGRGVGGPSNAWAARIPYTLLIATHALAHTHARTHTSACPRPPTPQALFCITIYLLGGLRWEAWAFFANVATMLLVTLVAQSWGLLLGAVRRPAPSLSL